MNAPFKNRHPPKGGAKAAAAVQVHLDQGFALHQQGKLAQAQAQYRQVLQLQPRHFDALHLLGLVATQQKDPAEAVKLITQALAIHPHFAAAHTNLGCALNDLLQHQAAIASYERAIQLKPESPNAWFNRGIALNDLRQYLAAIDSYDQAIRCKPDYAEAWDNRGNALNALKQHQAAIDSHDRALQLRPDFAKAWYHRGIALVDLKQYRVAVDSYDRAIQHQPDYAMAYVNRGNALSEQGQHQAATESHGMALKIKPDFAEAGWNQSLCLLKLGDFGPGWEAYEWRWKNADSGARVRLFPQPLWLGDTPLQDKTVLLHSEQGLGDTLQFYRYAKKVSDLGARVILEVQKPLLGLLSGLEGVAQLLAQGSDLPAFDFHCPLLSLPWAFKTDLASMPAPLPRLVADSAKLATWRGRLGPRNKPRVGVVWSGSTAHRNDGNRSLALSNFVSCMGDEFQYVSLQQELRDADRQALQAQPSLLHFGAELIDFTDTAALCALVDLVVTVDTSVAHLAGAMGKPVWILLPFNPDWRWLLERADSPWYPTARLYRQEHIGAWDEVLRRVRHDMTQNQTPMQAID
jgi:tetratricopeptide (TPR) repeat protein